MKLRDRFIEKLKAAMAARGWSQSDLATQMGVGRAYVQQYLSGLTTPGLGVVERFADALGLLHPWNILDDKPLVFADGPTQSAHEVIESKDEIIARQAAEIERLRAELRRIHAELATV